MNKQTSNSYDRQVQALEERDCFQIFKQRLKINNCLQPAVCEEKRCNLIAKHTKYFCTIYLTYNNCILEHLNSSIKLVQFIVCKKIPK
jgi:hypothetical protein